MASTNDQVDEPRTDPRFQDDSSSTNYEIDELSTRNIKNVIITNAPEERFRLGYWSVIALVVNRTIGLNSTGDIWQKLTKYCRNWHIQFAVDNYTGNEKRRYNPSFLACRRSVYNRGHLSEH
jgi:hypothetical protein